MDRTKGLRSTSLFPMQLSGKLVVDTGGPKFEHELSEVGCANNGSSTNDAPNDASRAPAWPKGRA